MLLRVQAAKLTSYGRIPLLSLPGMAALGALVWKQRWPTWGEWAWVTFLVLSLVLRSSSMLRYQRERRAENGPARGEKMFLPALSLTGIVFVLLDLTTPLLEFADYQLPVWAATLGVGLLLSSFWLFWRARTNLDRLRNPNSRRDNNSALTKQGRYPRICHPLAMAVWFSVMAQPLLLPNWIAGFMTLPLFAAMYCLRLPRQSEIQRSFLPRLGNEQKRRGREEMEPNEAKRSVLG